MSGEHDPHVVVLMTAWNRPQLLRRALMDVRREAEAIRAEVVISDDHSDDPSTHELLDVARHGGFVLIQPPDPRSESVSPHDHCQRNNLHAFGWVLEQRLECELILKVDDDIQLAYGAFAKMLEVRTRAIGGGLDVAQTSGIQTVHEETVGVGQGFAHTSSACNACVIYEAADWRKLLAMVNDEPQKMIDFMEHGFDWFFTRVFLQAARPHGKAIATRPSVCYHAGHDGLHTHQKDINFNYAGVP